MAGERIGTRIAGIGVYVPEAVLTSETLAKKFNVPVERILSLSGVRERHIADESQATSDLAVIAAQRALNDAGIAPGDVDLLILSTLCPDYMTTPTAPIVQEKLGIKNAAAFDLNIACSGFVYAVTIASQFIATGTYKNILVVCAELFSRLIDWENFDLAILAGDGAGAVVLQPGREGRTILSTCLGADGAGCEDIYVPAGGTRTELTVENVAAKMHKVRMKGLEVFMFGMTILPQATEKALRMAGLENQDAALIISHQANIRIIQAAARRMGLPMEKFMINMDRYGNTSSASIPIALDEAVKTERINPGDVVVLTGFGAGLAWGSIVMRW